MVRCRRVKYKYFGMKSLSYILQNIMEIYCMYKQKIPRLREFYLPVNYKNNVILKKILKCKIFTISYNLQNDCNGKFWLTNQKVSHLYMF